MIVYVNGDSHSAGAEAVKPYCFAQDDPAYWRLGKQPHPDNIQASYGCNIANHLGAVLDCDAESAASNDRIMRTTRQYLEQHEPDLVIIGWSTWEREEWFHDNVYYQVTASGTDSVPPALQDRYRKWVIDQDHVARERKMLYWHDQIYQLHQTLVSRSIPHLFFNTYSNFSTIRQRQVTTHAVTVIPNEYDWSESYVEPYNQNCAYYYWLKMQGHATVNPNSYHYNAQAHRAWSDFLLENYINKLLTNK